MEIPIVDKSRYPNALRAIFYDLSLNGEGGPLPSLFLISFPLLGFLYSLQLTDDVITKYLGLILGPIGILLPFFSSFLSYYSVVIFTDTNYYIKAFGVTYSKGDISDLLEIHRLEVYGGCFRVRVKGYSFTSGFLIHWRHVPDPLKHLSIIDIPPEP